MKSPLFQECAQPARTVSLHELVAQFLAKNPPKNKSDYNNVVKAFELLLELFPNADTANFTANQLLIFRNNLARRVSEKTGKTFSIDYVNKLVKFVRSVFNWGMNPNTKALSEADMVPPLVSETLGFALSKVPLLQPGEGRANPERKDVPDEHIEAALKVLPPVIADILRIQLLTAMRPGEVCKMRVGDIKRSREDFAMLGRLDFSGEMWLDELAEHKTAKKIGKKLIFLGAEEQKILRRYLQGRDSDPATPLFGNKRGRPMSGRVYSNAVKNVIAEHGLPKFVPYLMRHSNVSRNSLAFGQDVARAVVGHTTCAMTQRYDHSDLEKAFEVVKERNRQYLARRSMSGFGNDMPPKEPGELMLRVFSGE